MGTPRPVHLVGLVVVVAVAEDVLGQCRALLERDPQAPQIGVGFYGDAAFAQSACQRRVLCGDEHDRCVGWAGVRQRQLVPAESEKRIAMPARGDAQLGGWHLACEQRVD